MDRRTPREPLQNGRTSNETDVPARRPVPREAGRVGRVSPNETTAPFNAPDDEDMRHLIPLLSRTSLEAERGNDVTAAVAANAAARKHAAPSYMNEVDSRRVPPRGASLPQAARPDADTNFSRHIRNTSLDKPLPRPPVQARAPKQYENERPPPPPPHTQGYERRPNADGVDLRNTTDTTVQTQVAPAVTQETIRQDIHEIEEKRIFRETHEHHYVHRIQPIIEKEVLPARHFIKTSTGELQEVSASDLPGRVVIDDHMRQRAAGAAPRGTPKPPVRNEPHTTAVMSDGMGGTQSSTIYPPVLQEGGRESGQTKAFYLNSPNKKDDGFRDET